MTDSSVANLKLDTVIILLSVHSEQREELLGKCVVVDHRHQSKISDFTDVLDQLFAQFGDIIAKPEALPDITLDKKKRHRSDGAFRFIILIT